MSYSIQLTDLKCWLHERVLGDCLESIGSPGFDYRIPPPFVFLPTAESLQRAARSPYSSVRVFYQALTSKAKGGPQCSCPCPLPMPCRCPARCLTPHMKIPLGLLLACSANFPPSQTPRKIEKVHAAHAILHFAARPCTSSSLWLHSCITPCIQGTSSLLGQTNWPKAKSIFSQ
jgi:hypothetical protein